MNPDIYIRITMLELFQIRKQKIPHSQFAGADINFAALSVYIFLQHISGEFHLLARAADLTKEQLPFRSQGNAFLRTVKQLTFQIMLQVLNTLADRRLGQAEMLCCQSDIFPFSHFIKYFIVIVTDVYFIICLIQRTIPFFYGYTQKK